MDFDSIDVIKQYGFLGFIRIADLQASNCCEVDEKRGVYLVLRLASDAPRFLEPSVGGYYNGRDPTVLPEELSSKWVSGSKVIYIGKAASLKRRLRLYMQFGLGKPKAHYGGRYVWQLADYGELQICWKPTPDTIPRELEKQLIAEFKARYCGKRPFANLCD